MNKSIIFKVLFILLLLGCSLNLVSYAKNKEPEIKEDVEIIASKRINIDYAEEAVDYLYRFTIKDNKYISVPIKK